MVQQFQDPPCYNTRRIISISSSPLQQYVQGTCKFNTIFTKARVSCTCVSWRVHNKLIIEQSSLHHKLRRCLWPMEHC